METPKKKLAEKHPPEIDFFDSLWEDSWTYIKTVVDVLREPVLILSKELTVIAANEAFYQTFQVNQAETEEKLVYKLGNGQWDIPELRKLLEDILPKETFFKGFEVAHTFPTIGRKVMILNARQIHFKNEETVGEKFRCIIILAMEDVTEMMGVAEMLARQTNQYEIKTAARTDKLEIHIKQLVREINELKKDSGKKK